MATEGAKIVRAHIEAFLAKDTERSASFLDEHVVRDWRRIGILDPTGYGIEKLVEGTLHYRSAFGDYDWTLANIRDLGSGQVLVELDEAARGRESGAPAERSYAVLYSLIAGRIVRITAFPSADEALESIGISD